MVSLAAEGLGLAIGSYFSVTVSATCKMYFFINLLQNTENQFQNGCAIGPLAIAPFLGLAIYGFDFAKSIPMLMNLVMKTSFLRCGVVAMVLTIFGFNRKPLDCDDIYCHFAKPNILLDYLDLTRTSVWFEIGIITTIMIFFRLLSYLALRQRFAT